MKRAQKITLGEMRASGPQRLLVYCGDYKCAHSVVIDAGRWPDDVRLPEAISPYSMAVAPVWSCRKRAKSLVMEHSR